MAKSTGHATGLSTSGPGKRLVVGAVGGSGRRATSRAFPAGSFASPAKGKRRVYGART
jgi:hypothetical protein